MSRLIDLAVGRPDPRLLPLDEMRRAAAHRLGMKDADLLQYAPERGTESMRRRLGGFISADPDRLFITQGASHGLDLILSRFVRDGDVVLVEEPTYFHALKILRGRRLKIVPVPSDARGLDVEALEKVLEREKPKLLYTIPIHHNPTGATLPADRRARLIELARAHDFLIVADEVYQLLTYDGDPPPPLSTLDPARVFSLGSFSKILAPGLRLGWIDAAPDHLASLAQCGVMISGGGASPFTSAIIESAIENGIAAAYLARIREEYGRRCYAMIRSIENRLPPDVTFEWPSGGFFVWLRLARGTDTEALLARARAELVGFLPGGRTSVEGGHTDRLRLCFTYYDEEEIDSAIQRLAKILN
jgi:2-aminoadipate transaminase